MSSPLDESEFWARLQYRVHQELIRFVVRWRRAIWCSGLVPQRFDLDGPQPRITGLAYCGHGGADDWEFVLLLPPGTARTRAEIEWASLMPGADTIGWLSPYPDGRRLVIDPSGAVPDEESEFWAGLEYRITREFAGFADSRLRTLWCDGLIPERYDLDGPQPQITGLAHCGHNGQDRWEFVLLLPPGTPRTPDRIDWVSLMPGDDVTEWLSPLVDERRLVIDPQGAVPDELSTGSN